jgi:flagellar basal-body rod protein FlgC
MLDPLQAAMHIAGSGLGAQSVRLRVISENIANAQSVGATPGADPYARKTVTFDTEVDRASGVGIVGVKKIGVDKSSFKIERDPGSPAADSQGFVKLPNVDVLSELTDMREANRSYEANLQVAKQSGELLAMTINLLKDS